jgi:hypothetical protein
MDTNDGLISRVANYLAESPNRGRPFSRIVAQMYITIYRSLLSLRISR